jgi:hypothetical protein
VSTYVLIKNNGDGTIRYTFQPAGGTLSNPQSARFDAPSNIVRNTLYHHAIRIKHGETSANGYFEWWVNGTLLHQGARPTAYLCADGLSGERLQIGIYRGAFSGTTTLYMGDFKVGTTRASVS